MLITKFQKYIEYHTLCTKSDKILLAVSGGVDSMVLLSLFARCGYNIGVAHCNFKLRGVESEEDEQLVEQEAGRYGVPFYNIRFNTQAEVDRSGESVQMVARRLRYEWFDALCAEHGYTHIAIAHHADDSVETFFINMLRGTGLRGLTGINVINGKLIRPMLFSPRKDIIEFAISNQVGYREDSSNSSTKYLRNKIRLGIVPRIREISPLFTETMTSNVEKLTSAQKFIDMAIENIRQAVFTHEGDQHILDLTKIDSRYPFDFVVYELLRVYGFSGEVTDKMCRCIHNGACSGKRFYSGFENIAYIDRNTIIISKIDEDDACNMEIPENSSRLHCLGTSFTIDSIDVNDIDTLKQPDNVALLDFDKLTFPLKVRRWKEGDSFVPFGMTGHKKVSDLLIDGKVSIPDKKRQMVVLSGNDIVWVVGRRVDDRYAVGSSTEQIFRIIKDTDIIY